MCYKMGLKPREVDALTLKEFDLMVTGYQEREEERWDMTRHLMWAMISYGGMGLKKPITPQETMPLNKDRKYRKRYIINEFQAIEFIKTFYQ